MGNNDNPSKIEIAKTLKQVKAISTNDDYNTVKRVLCPTTEDGVEEAISGLTEEDEFILLSMLMGTAEHPTPLEQRQAIAQDSAAPDVLVRFRPGFRAKGIPPAKHIGYKCLVEVKSTIKSKFKMSGAALAKLRNYADAYGLPLVFAVRMKLFATAAIWILVEDTDRTKPSITVSFGDLLKGLRPVLWDDYYYLLLPGTVFESIYDKKKNGIGITNRKYGSQVGFDVITTQGRFKYKGMNALIARAFFAPFGLEEVEMRRHGNRTVVTYVNHNTALTVADLVYGLNCLPTDEDENRTYNASRVMRKMADGVTQYVVNRDFVEDAAFEYLKIGALAILEMGDTEDRYAKWLQTGGTE